MIRIGICDDMEEDLRRVEEVVLQAVESTRFNIEVKCFNSGEKLLRDMDEWGRMDIVFLDIFMKKMSGVETARRIRQKDFLSILIFVSMYDQYCKELINVQPFAFIDKPASKEELKQVLRRAIDRKSGDREVFYYTYKKVTYHILLSHIRYFESHKREIHIHSVDEYGMFYGKLDEVEEKLKAMNTRFIRINKSYLVDLLYVKEFRYNRVKLDNGKELLISPKYRPMVRECFVSVAENMCL